MSYSRGLRRRARYNGPHLSGNGERQINNYEVLPGRHPPAKGATLRDAKLAYKTYGTLNEDKSNVIAYPTWYSGRHRENEWLIGGMALDPDEYFFIVPKMLGNNLSTSPSNTPPLYSKARFPDVAVYDNDSL